MIIGILTYRHIAGYLSWSEVKWQNVEAIRSFWLFKESITTSGTEAQLDKITQHCCSRLPKFIFNSMYMVYVHLTLQFIQ